MAGPSLRQSAVRLICVELYRDCVALRWHRLLTAHETAARDEFRPFANFPDKLLEQGAARGRRLRLHDNYETRYQRVGGDSAMTHEYSRRRDDKPTPVWGYATFTRNCPGGRNASRSRQWVRRFVVALTND